METFHYPHFPPDLSIAHVALFTKVTNSAELRLRLIKAASLPGEEGDIEREAVNFAFIDATKVRSDDPWIHIQLSDKFYCIRCAMYYI